MSKRGERFDKVDRQDNAIPILILAKTRSEACREIGISRETLYGWFKEPEFLAKYRAAQRERYDHAMVMLVNLTDKAVQSLQDILDGDAPAAIKVQAANTVLNHAKSHCMDMELEDRVAELENKLLEMAKDK